MGDVFALPLLGRRMRDAKPAKPFRRLVIWFTSRGTVLSLQPQRHSADTCHP